MQRKTSPVQLEPIDFGLHCSVPEQRRLLGESPYFKSLTSEQVVEVQKEFQQNHYHAEDVIHFAGDEATRISIVGAGTVKLVRSTLEGKDIVIDMLTPGDHFGSLAELGDATYRETAIAHTECCILSTTAPVFARMMEKYPAVAIDSLKMVAARLSNAQSTIEQLSAHPVEQRIVQTLLHLAGKTGKDNDNGILIDIPLSRQDIADMTGTTVESASRVMSELRKAGEIDSGRRWISILDVEALRERLGY